MKPIRRGTRRTYILSDPWDLNRFIIQLPARAGGGQISSVLTGHARVLFEEVADPERVEFIFEDSKYTAPPVQLGGLRLGPFYFHEDPGQPSHGWINLNTGEIVLHERKLANTPQLEELGIRDVPLTLDSKGFMAANDLSDYFFLLVGFTTVPDVVPLLGGALVCFCTPAPGTGGGGGTTGTGTGAAGTGGTAPAPAPAAQCTVTVGAVAVAVPGTAGAGGGGMSTTVDISMSPTSSLGHSPLVNFIDKIYSSPTGGMPPAKSEGMWIQAGGFVDLLPAGFRPSVPAGGPSSVPTAPPPIPPPPFSFTPTLRTRVRVKGTVVCSVCGASAAFSADSP